MLTTSLTPAQADTAEVVGAYRQLQTVENKFRVLKDFPLRPVRHWTEKRVRGHVAVCVYAALMETLITQALTAADIRDPDLEHQHLRRTGPPTTQPRPPRGRGIHCDLGCRGFGASAKGPRGHRINRHPLALLLA